MTSGDSLGFTQTTWDFNPEKWMSSLVNLVNIHFPMTPTCGLPGLSPHKLSSWIMGFTFFPAAGGWGCWSPVLCFPLVWGDVWILRAFFSSGDVWFGTPEIHQRPVKKTNVPHLRFGIWMSHVFYPFPMASFLGGAMTKALGARQGALQEVGLPADWGVISSAGTILGKPLENHRTYWKSPK
jgi:hypothetical protein